MIINEVRLETDEIHALTVIKNVTCEKIDCEMCPLHIEDKECIRLAARQILERMNREERLRNR